MSDVRPPNEHVSYPGDQPWHVPFPSPPLTPNHDPTLSGSEAESNDPLDEISAASSTTSNICLRQQIDYNWSEIDVAGVWEVLNMGAEGMAHHSLVHAARRKDKDMDLLMDL
ncbi:hypothetical protein L3X38_008771 [Prunus dulcis]|uniref:Uncharacterized protein n=1 Tax=Prunus dulcis TaxID=3755 RepID=A0AAD5F759_PRUDU|nr:hypothetical protein L3X38_008771 [Prunus dulcis]